MGNVLSSDSAGGVATKEAASESGTMDCAGASSENDARTVSEEFHDASNESEVTLRDKAREESMCEFNKELNMKREQRKTILARHRTEKEELERSLANERKTNIDLQETNKLLRDLLRENNIIVPEELKFSEENAEMKNAIAMMSEDIEKARTNNIKLRKDLAQSNRTLQNAFSDIADLTAQNTESMKQINALKEVISVSKTLMGLREEQLIALKNKLAEIEQSLAERETNMLSADLRQEYERQLLNIRTLRGLYEERARLAEVTRQGILRELEEQKSFYQIEVNKNNEFKTQVENLETQIVNLNETIDNKNCKISTFKDETRVLQAEMTVVNKLFSQVLLGYKNKQDLDKLVHRLEENHGLLTQMAGREDGSEASSELPKLLLELVSQVDDGESETDIAKLNYTKEKGSKGAEASGAGSKNPTNTTPEEIVENLPRVWRVLMELLSHQNVAYPDATEKVTTCYKSVETTSGPVLVPSVSQTYIRLKDLIVEKLSLIKEVNRMKQLNGHLESRLGEQEKRLCLVTTELSKTWHVVGRLRRHHHQLHTHEKILKYELQQKRKLLNELKQELEYCREKWDQAREKNSQSEKDWKKLRAEFSGRKKIPISSSLNHSAESGYSDERPSDSSDSNDENECLNEPLVRCKKKFKKSFETIIDSSTDVNVAEREDPVSDMLDVADLPLDAQEGDDNHESSTSECCNSDKLLRSEKSCVETEDEVGDLCNESWVEETSTAETEGKSSTSQSDKTNSENQSAKTVVTIDPAAIVESIKRQNDRLAQRDKKLDNLEKSSEALLKQMQNTLRVGDNINSTLDHLINRPSANFNIDQPCTSSNVDTEGVTSLIGLEKGDSNKPLSESLDKNMTVSEIGFMPENQSDDTISSSLSKLTPESDAPPHRNHTTESNILLINPKAIMESIKIQNERITKRDERLTNLEDGCAEVVKHISNTLEKGDEIMQKLDILQDKQLPSDANEDNKQMESQETQDNNVIGIERMDTINDPDAGPSTSSVVDHEARFAARDLRLSRLEEQTRSLVKKMNKTSSKGVKIQYKLQELHNIYGSEGSRAGTPSEGNEEPTEDDDDEITE